MRLYRTTTGCFVEEGGSYFLVNCASWDQLLAEDDIEAKLRGQIEGGRRAVISMPPTCGRRL